MPEKLDRCVDDVKADGKSTSSAFAICNSSIKEEVGTAIGIAGVEEIDDETHQEVSTALGIAGVGISESHSPLDKAGYEAPDDPVAESVSIPNSASNISIGADTKKIEEIGKDIVKQILETQIGECPCKTKSRPKA